MEPVDGPSSMETLLAYLALASVRSMRKRAKQQSTGESVGILCTCFLNPSVDVSQTAALQLWSLDSARFARLEFASR